MRGGERRHAGSTQRTERGLGTHRHSLRQLNSKRSGGGGGNSSCGDLPSSAAAAPLLAKRSALYGDPCPLCAPGAPGCMGPRSVPLGGRAGDGPPPAAEADTSGLRAAAGGAEAAVEVGIGGEGSARGGHRAPRLDASDLHGRKAANHPGSRWLLRLSSSRARRRRWARCWRRLVFERGGAAGRPRDHLAGPGRCSQPARTRWLRG